MNNEATEPLEEAKKKKTKRMKRAQNAYTYAPHALTKQTSSVILVCTQTGKACAKVLQYGAALHPFPLPQPGAGERGVGIRACEVAGEVVRRPTKKSSAEAMQPDATTTEVILALDSYQ